MLGIYGTLDKGLLTCNVFLAVSIITTVIVQHWSNGDGVNNGQNVWRIHSVCYFDDNKNNNGQGPKNVTCKQTINSGVWIFILSSQSIVLNQFIFNCW